MIKIKVYFNKDNELIELRSFGHAEATSPTVSHSQLCTAISTLEYQFLYSIQNLVPELELNPKINSGSFELSLKKIKKGKVDSFENKVSANQNLIKNPTLTILSQSFLIGIKMLVDKYPSEIEFEVAEG